MVSGIKHIIFDLGGVLLNIDYQLTEDAFIGLGIGNFGELYSQLQQTTLFDDLETGKIEVSVFYERLLGLSGVQLSHQQIETAWNAMLLDFPLRRLQLLQQLRIHYDLVLLSNTNSIHEKWFNNALRQQHGIPSLGAFFDKVYFSHRVGMRKPGKDIFQLILESNGFNPGETLFIDDSPQHIAAAEELGIQSIWLEKGMTIEKDIFKPKVQ